VYANPDSNEGRDILAGGTPTTFVISPTGVVKEVWHGAYAGKVKEEIEAKLRVQLPGVDPNASQTPHAP
jgi:peroxiredoxin